jgi:CDP-diacylglycerol--glycerol-3-phosphate 3-phosphatidyltransferase
VANVLTVIRVFLVPVVAVLVAWDGGTNTAVRLAAAALFAVAALTDRLDGHLARSRGLITDFGKIADPIADKALILVTLAVLCWQGAVSWWAWIIIAVRELGITALRLAVVKHAVIPANLGGKIKTVVQIVAIGLYILPRPWPWAIWTAAVFMILAVALTVATGVEYVFQATSILSAARTQRRGSIR